MSHLGYATLALTMSWRATWLRPTAYALWVSYSAAQSRLNISKVGMLKAMTSVFYEAAHSPNQITEACNAIGLSPQDLQALVTEAFKATERGSQARPRICHLGPGLEELAKQPDKSFLYTVLFQRIGGLLKTLQKAKGISFCSWACRRSSFWTP